MRISTLLLRAICLSLALSVAATAQDKTGTDKPAPTKEGIAPSRTHLTSRRALVAPHPNKHNGSGATLSETFNDVPSGEIPSGWSQFEAGSGTVETWAVLPYSSTDPSLGKAAGVFYEDVASGLAIDYLVTPQLSISSGDRLSALLYESYTEEYGSTYEIRLSTTGNASAADFTEVLATYTESDLPTIGEGATPTTFDLSAYAGMDVYIAFVFINDDGDVFVIDDVTVGPAPAGAEISVSTDNVDFGNVPTGEDAVTTVQIGNTGGAELTISSITASGDGFSVDTDDTDLTLAPGASTTFTVTFSPTADGAASGSISIVSDAASSPTEISLSGSGVSAPENDDIADATPITMPGIYTGTNVFATLEAGEPVPSCQSSQGSSVYWAFTPSSDGEVVIDLSASDFDTVLSFHQADGTEIACDDDGGTDTTSRLANLSVSAGTTYLIRIAGYSSFLTGETATGNISFTIEQPRPLAASFSGSTDMGPFDRPFVSASTGACSVSGTGANVMYGTTDITVTQDGTFDIVVRDFALDAVLIVYEGGAFDPADVCTGLVSYEDVNGDDGGETESDLELAAGTYTVVVTGFESTDTGSYTVDLRGENIVVVANEADTAPLAARLSTPQPNPTAGVTSVSLDLGNAESVSLTVLDLLGREVLVLHQGPLAGGTAHTFQVNASALPAGQYLIRAQGESFASTKRLTVVR